MPQKTADRKGININIRPTEKELWLSQAFPYRGKEVSHPHNRSQTASVAVAGGIFTGLASGVREQQSALPLSDKFTDSSLFKLLQTPNLPKICLIPPTKIFPQT